MSKYDRLGAYLREQDKEQVPMTFAEIERVTGLKLPKSQEYQAWWSNSTSNNVMTKVWLDAGYRTEQVDTVSKRLVFKRERRVLRPPAIGMAEEARKFKPADPKAARHPAIGALKGLLWIEPGYDLTQPTWGEEEEKAFNEKWDRLLK